jgi:arylsulfatase A-like enzyme
VLAKSYGQPAQPMQGKSLVPVLRDADASAPRNEQYYECWANRAYYRDGWVAVSLQKRGEAIDFDNWTLHSHTEDFSESMDLARRHPQKLAELVGLSTKPPGPTWSIRSTTAHRRQNFSSCRRISGLRPVAGDDFCRMRRPFTAT